MAAVFPRRRGTARPFYLPTAIQERLAGMNAVQPYPGPGERHKLEAKGVSPAILDALIVPTIHPAIPLPPTPIPARPTRVYNPDDTTTDRGNPDG